METEHEKAEGNLFNDLMDYIGTEGKFQSRFNYLYNMTLMVLVAMPALNIVLALTSPDHWCHVPGRNATNYTTSEWKELTIPKYKFLFYRKGVHMLLYLCMLHFSTDTSACFIHNYSMIFRFKTNATHCKFYSHYSDATFKIMFNVIVSDNVIIIIIPLKR
jgi:hypothetical protein